MEKKKTDKANIERQRLPFILTSFLFVGGLTLASFTFKASLETSGTKSKMNHVADIVFQSDPKEITPPQQPQQQEVVIPPQEEIRVDSNTTVIPDPNINITPPDITLGNQIVHIDPPPVELFPDVEAMFPGGTVALHKWIADNIIYPETAVDLGDEGKVYLSFVVELDGSITDIQIERGVTDELDREAKRVIRKMPNWIPGETRGKKVRTKCRLPIVFEID